MCEEKELEATEEIQVLFSDDIQILEDRIADVILAMGLPEEQTDAVLRLMNDAIEAHHLDILDTFEDIYQNKEEEAA